MAQVALAPRYDLVGPDQNFFDDLHTTLMRLCPTREKMLWAFDLMGFVAQQNGMLDDGVAAALNGAADAEACLEQVPQ